MFMEIHFLCCQAYASLANKNLSFLTQSSLFFTLNWKNVITHIKYGDTYFSHFLEQSNTSVHLCSAVFSPLGEKQPKTSWVFYKE